MQRLIDIQQRLKAPKGQYNSFGGYAYRSCEDILEAVKPLLNENEATLKITDDIVMLGDRYYIKATATLYGSDGKEVASSSGFAREELTKKGADASQITGAASYYARKYALNGLFLIDDTKDADATNTHGKDEPKENKKEKPQFAVDASNYRRAYTNAVKKGTDLPVKPLPTKEELEEKGKKFDDWFNGLGDKAMSNSQIDYVNNFIDELERAGLKAKAIEVRAKKDTKLGIDDCIPDFGEDLVDDS
jgi:hypothetical protein